MRKEDVVLILGGGFGGARLAQELANSGFSSVTLIDRKDYFEVTYSTLRTLVQPTMGEEAKVKYDRFLKTDFLQKEVIELNEEHVLFEDGSTKRFHAAVVTTGSSYQSLPLAKTQDALSINERADELTDEHKRLIAANNILIVGGGAVGVELAGEIADRFPDKKVTIVEAGNRLLSTLKPRAGAIANKLLNRLGVYVVLNTRLDSQSPIQQEADIVYMCVGLNPNTDLMQSHFSRSLDETKRIKVDAQLRMEGSPNIYAIGDCASVCEQKFGYVADAQAVYLAKSFVSLSQGNTPKPYKAPPVVSLVPIGRKKGLAQLPIGVSTFGFLVNMKQKDMFIRRQFRNLAANA